jgi:hypothetical protein
MIRSHDHAAGLAARTLAHPPHPYRANADIQNGYARARLAFNGPDRLANLACEVPIGRLSLDDYAKQLSPGTRTSAATRVAWRAAGGSGCSFLDHVVAPEPAGFRDRTQDSLPSGSAIVIQPLPSGRR